MIQKQAFPVPFSQGLDTKTDPKQVQIGKFLSLENTIFGKGGLLQKRNGFGSLTTIGNDSSTDLTTFNGNLTAIGSSINAYNENLMNWVSKGSYYPVSLSTLPLIRNAYNQVQNDTAIARGMVLTTYTTVVNSVSSYYYALADMTTGQNIIEPSTIPVLSGGTINGSSRAFVVGVYFVIVSPVSVSGSTYLQYFSIPINNPTIPSAAQNVYPEIYVPITSNPGWDGVATNQNLVVAYNTTAGGQGVHVTDLTEQDISSNASAGVVHAFTGATDKAAILSICVDITESPNIYYISFWNKTTTNGYTAAVYIGFGTITQQFAPQQIITTTTVVNLASAAQNGSCLVFSEVANSYGYDSSIPTNYIDAVTVSSAGTVGTPYVAVRSVGLGSKAFIVDGEIYFLAAFQSPFQPSYFLIDGGASTASAPLVVAKLAYENGGGYVTLGLPSVSVSGQIASLSYLFKDLVAALTTLGNTQQTTTGGIYSQTGVNLVDFTIKTTGISSSEIGSNLNLGGGFGWMYDGYLPVEQDFFLWPDSVEITYNDASTITPTGTASSGSFTIVVSSATGVYAGMTIADSTNSTYIPAGTTIIKVSGTTVTMSAAATHAISGDTLSIQGNIAAQPDGETNTDAYYYQALYQWSDNQGNIFRSAPSIPVPVTTTSTGTAGTVTIDVPTLRLTYKIPNPLTIIIYRWSVANPEYHQVTSITAPITNSTTTDYISFVDTLPDSSIVGNSIIYTTGGVVEDINPPSYSITTLFDTRQWVVDAEDPNLMWYSKQIIEGTPVEFSDLLTYYVAPNTGTVSSTGPITALFPMDDKLIIWKANAIFYINGTGPDNTGANSTYSQPIFITATTGSPNPRSIVFTPAGLMYQSEDGIWLLGRDLSTTYIGAPVENFNGSTVLSAVNIPETTQVRFTLNTGEHLLYDYFYGNWGTFIGASGISSCIYNNLHTYLNSAGQVFQETPGVYLDGDSPVLISFVTGWIQVQGISGYQRIYELQLLGEYFSPHLLNFQIGYDFGALSEQVLIQPTNYTGVYGSDSLYGQTSPDGGPSSLEQWRIQPSTQKCQAFQIAVSEVYDPSFGVPSGAGFTLSAMTLVLGINRGYRPVKAANTAGTSN